MQIRIEILKLRFRGGQRRAEIYGKRNQGKIQELKAQGKWEHIEIGALSENDYINSVTEILKVVFFKMMVVVSKAHIGSTYYYQVLTFHLLFYFC